MVCDNGLGRHSRACERLLKKRFRTGPVAFVAQQHRFWRNFLLRTRATLTKSTLRCQSIELVCWRRAHLSWTFELPFANRVHDLNSGTRVNELLGVGTLRPRPYHGVASTENPRFGLRYRRPGRDTSTPL